MKFLSRALAMAYQIKFETNEIIYDVGDVANGAYIILKGHVDLLSRSGIRLTTLGEGEIFGEIGQIIGTARSVTARARSNGAANFIPKEQIKEKFETADAAVTGIFRAVAVRLQHSNQDIETLHDKYEKLRADHARLSAELARYKRTL